MKALVCTFNKEKAFSRHYKTSQRFVSSSSHSTGRSQRQDTSQNTAWGEDESRPSLSGDTRLLWWWREAAICYQLVVQVLAMVTRVWPPLPLAQSRAAETATLTLSREGAPPATTALNIRSTKTELLLVSLPPLSLPPSTWHQTTSAGLPLTIWSIT